MSIINENDGSGSGNNPNKRNLRIKKQREDVAKIFEKVREVAKKNAEGDVDKIIDLGLIQSRTEKGFAQLFNNAPGSWEPLFPIKFYRHIYRLNNWVITDESLKHRPGIVGTWTNWMIYIRFPIGTIKWLREQRILSGGTSSGLKFHQYTTKDGRKLIKNFIGSAISLMRKCNNWEQFKRLLAKGYGKTYQPDMFDSDEVNWKPK